MSLTVCSCKMQSEKVKQNANFIDMYKFYILNDVQRLVYDS
jgi:hypothetical protein